MTKKVLRLIAIFALLAIMLTACDLPFLKQSTSTTEPPAQSTTTGGNVDPEPEPEPDPNPEPEPDPDNMHTPTIYLAGDSTVKTYDDSQYIGGWGQFLSLFIADGVKIVNAANGGRSSRSFINEGRLYNIDDASFNYSFSQNDGKSIEDCIVEGDYLFIQFGHNDDDSKMSSSYTTIYDRMVPLGEPDANGIYPTTPAVKVPFDSLPEEYTSKASVSEKSKALETTAKYGSEYYGYHSGGTYKWYLKQYIDFARSVGAIPVLITPVARVKFSGDTIIGGAGLHGENFAYVEAVRQLATEENCILIDLFADSKTILEAATPTYANYLMALKPNELNGPWPSGYDAAYGNTEAGYTGIEATHYNKYGAFLQAAKIAEFILDNASLELANGERFTFSGHVLSSPKEYIDPSNLMSKSSVAAVEELFETVNVTNPNRVYPDPAEVVELISTYLVGEVTIDNHLAYLTKCEEIRAKYDGLNIDDRASVTNFAVLEEYELAVKEMIDASRPEPTKVVVFNANDLLLSTYTDTQVEQGFTLVATSDKTMDKKSKKAAYTYNGVSYTNEYGLSLGGSAKFGTSRYVSFTVDGPCTVTVAIQSSGSSVRTLNLANAGGSVIGSFEAGTAVTVSSIEITEAGTYSVGSAGSGIYIFSIIIEYYEQ